MRKIIVVLITLLAVLTGVSVVEARGGRDDCTAGSTDPDCAGAGGR